MQGKIKLTLLVGIFCQITLLAQPKDNSPITRYGLGDLYRGDFNQTGATGGLFGAWVDPYRVNPVNPASMPFLQSTSLEFGFFSRYNAYRRNNSEENVWSGNLDYISLAFPLKSRINEALEPSTSPWDFAMGVQVTPFSQVGYDVEFTQYIQDIDTIENIFTGQGGLSQASWSGGAKYKNLSFGVQAGYVFGRITNNSQLDLLSQDAAYSTRNFNSFNLRGFTWLAGLMYRVPLDPEQKGVVGAERQRRWINIGAYGGSPTNYNTRTVELIERVNLAYSSGGSVARDTLVFNEDASGKGTLPGRFGAGVTLQKGDIYQVGFNAEVRAWEGFNLTNKQEIGLSFRNAYRVSVGGEWTPDAGSFKRYLRRIRYRAGMFYEQDPRVIDGKNMDGLGLQLGFGFPVILPRQQVSFLEFAVEAGRRGDLSIQQDNYIRLRLAATLNDNSWFFKRKYN
ncbi:MAG: hypothetical protein KA479_12275 [Saprospiraceae bacterium]|nr:hypothetical protein [Saprospiraceae bacterium]